MRILGIHGIGNYRPGESPETATEQLSSIWAKQLAAGADRAGRAWEVETVYYADLLRAPGRQGDDSELDDMSAEEEELLRLFLPARQAAGDRVPQGRLTAFLRAEIADIAASQACNPRVLEWLMGRLVREVARYLTVGPAREQVQNRLTEAIERHRPDVLIAHSLGSVVAYETLHGHQGPAVPLWVTLGSPLAAPKAIFHRLTPAPVGGFGSRPERARRWANLADPGDLVAIPAKGVSRCFTGVESDRHDLIHAFDFHKAANYLKAPQLARLLATV
ncbi:serine peptidase [Kitasatospora sp. NBC_00240]|uniref:serine peptidase n=1 Tax=Kitasatospora sp. NBC_00240 TaxID=2903567 RepID=UPI00224D0EEB|nr:serine peptidase [Kitasatospora sp. NBC_00240]MCX5209298.1 serine peptidase [Kitasatospora sp. NBC_00240]